MSCEREASLSERLNDKLHRLALLLLLAYIVLSSFGPVMDNVDLGWHIAEGRWMVQHAALYQQDILNYPNLGHPIIDEYPLFQIVLYAAWSLGWWGPCLLTALVYALLTGALIRAGRDCHLTASSSLVMALGLMFLFLHVGALLRPHLVTYLAIVLLGVFLLRQREATSWSAFWPMALLQVAWTNSHGGFVIGPAMVGLFGAEMVVRHALRDRAVPWLTIKTWLGAFLLILLACFVNPHGVAQFYPPLLHQNLESGRAYTGEMEPLGGVAALLYGGFAFLAAAIVTGAGLRRGKTLSFSFLLFALLFYYEAEAAKKAWPVFGLFVPLLILSTGAFASPRSSPRPAGWPGVFAHFLVTVLVASALYLKLAPAQPISLQSQWRELARGHSELSLDAAAWMKAHGAQGRLFHRCEDGGWLQQVGFDHGETFSDTGFGKYDPDFIHEVGLVNERPALVPRHLQAYQPDYVVCSTFCYQWPFYLRQSGWRLVFYSPNSSVWARPGLRPDLPTVSNEEVMAAFARDSRPTDFRLYGRNLLALNSLGLEDFVVAQLQGLPKGDHHAPWYWEAARILCFDAPSFSPAHRDQLNTEAIQLHDDALTAEFRAYCLNASGNTAGALRILEAIPKDKLSNGTAELLLKIYLDQKRPEALALARRTDCFDLRNGRHRQYLAQAEEQAGHPEAAALAWERAVFYYPDDASLMAGATAFAARYHDAELARVIAASTHVYGQR